MKPYEANCKVKKKQAVDQARQQEKEVASVRNGEENDATSSSLK
jgi:hypothetical protein